MSEIAVIIPMNKFGNENVELLNQAIDSVPDNMKVILSVPNSTTAKDLKSVSNRIQLIQETDGTSFAELVNAAVDKVQEKWFSILEFDDTYTDIWLNNAEKYIEFMPDVSAFMFLEDIVDFNTKKYIGFGNAEAYASSFSNELGFIDNDCLQNYFDFYLTGSIFNKEDWKEVGGLKPSMKLTFWYEWMLRATYKGKKIFVIPKVGYSHNLNRDGSLVATYRETLSEQEIQFYFDVAKREYFFKEERPEKAVYKPEEAKEEE